MKKIILSSILILTLYYSQGQLFYFNVPNTQFQAEAGAGFDTRLYIGFVNPYHTPVVLSAQPPQGIITVFQADTIDQSDTIVLSVMVKDTALTGQNIFFTIKARDSSSEITKVLTVQIPDYGNLFPENPAIKYRDTAISFLMKQHPEIIYTYGNLAAMNWQGFWQYPPLLVVSNYVFLTNNWRCNVLWHIMIPPYDWKKIFIYNNSLNIGWGVNIDTDGNCTEIPCEKHYYFYQDTNALKVENADYSDNSDKFIKNFPNPCITHTLINFSNPESECYTLSVYDIKAQLIKEYKNIRGTTVNIDVSQQESGFYFFQLKNSKTVVAHGKIIKIRD